MNGKIEEKQMNKESDEEIIEYKRANVRGLNHHPTMSFTSLLITVLLVSGVASDIKVDFNCTSYDGTAFVYTPAAVACEDAIPTPSCQALYKENTEDDGWPTAGLKSPRPFACYTTGTADTAPIVQDMKTASLANCAKTCGLCCQTDAYNCPNVNCTFFHILAFNDNYFSVPRLNCNTITKSQCTSVAWRTIIAQDCPSACGFCNEGGCVDAVTNCGNDLSICNTVGMQEFVNTYCQRTCGRCPSTTGSATTVAGATTGSSCTSFAADSSSSCAAWAANGFCTNNFYTEAQRRARCATTCRLC
uniref:ShKT domain-containing protein n=1 Tax=Caenorhabditis tropicalis TaxID=1561998 RepID=A0A1I7TXN5_9PELO